MPYCLERLADGSYLPLNRRYKPIGQATLDFVDYETVKAGRVKITPAKARKLEYRPTLDPARIYLYNDGCLPDASAEHWQRYAERLALLAKLSID